MTSSLRIKCVSPVDWWNIFSCNPVERCVKTGSAQLLWGVTATWRTEQLFLSSAELSGMFYASVKSPWTGNIWFTQKNLRDLRIPGKSPVIKLIELTSGMSMVMLWMMLNWIRDIVSNTKHLQHQVRTNQIKKGSKSHATKLVLILTRTLEASTFSEMVTHRAISSFDTENLHSCWMILQILLQILNPMNFTWSVGR